MSRAIGRLVGEWSGLDLLVNDAGTTTGGLTGADDWLSLPPLIENPIHVELPPHARELYDKVEHDLIVLLNGATVLAKNAAVLVSKLLQIANGAVFDDRGNWHPVHDAKLDALDELLEATSGGVLCAYAFKPDAERIHTMLDRQMKHIIRLVDDLRLTAALVKTMQKSHARARAR